MSTIDLTKADRIGYIPDRSKLQYGENISIYRHFKGGYYVIVGFSFDAETDRWKYGYLDAYLYRDILLGTALALNTPTVPFLRTPENFHELVTNNRPYDATIESIPYIPRFLVTPFTLKTLPDNKTLFD